MNRKTCRHLGIGLLVLSAILCRASENLPAAAEVTRRMVARAQKNAGQAAPYTYEKNLLIEELDSQDRVLKSTVKVHQVKLIAGLPFSRLTRIQGQQLTEEELRKEDQREEAFRQKATAVDMKKMAERKEAWLTPQLMDKFEFAVRDRMVLNGRSTWLLDFAPKPGSVNVKTTQDKVLSRLAGSVWVDEAEAETAKFSVRLQSPISLGWFGMFGSLNQCDLKVERIRMPEGVWINSRQSMLLAGRKLISPMRVRTTEESSGFTKE